RASDRGPARSSRHDSPNDSRTRRHSGARHRRRRLWFEQQQQQQLLQVGLLELADRHAQARRQDRRALGPVDRRRARWRFRQGARPAQADPRPTGSGSISKAGVARFPITGGNVTYYKPGSVNPYVQGAIDHAGSGLSLTGGGKKVTLSNFVVDPGASVLTGKVSVDGKEAAASAPLFFLDGRTLKPLAAKDDGTAVLAGTTVKLKQEAADLLNQTFGVKALKGGLVIGIAKITVNAK
ncbi:MAG: hypothetical protein M3P44_13320, partial [Actinomycetota bacterium]|nr:hypothetical protein [Actinomycetota bacterium]